MAPTTTEQQGPGPVATVTAPGEDGAMALTSAQRQARLRARQKAGETLPTCSSCGARLQPYLRQRGDRQGDGICWRCWIKTPAGLEAERERGRRTREADLERARELARERARRWRQRVREQQGQGVTAEGTSQGGEAQG